MSTELTKYEPILKLLKENEGKLQVFLTADEKVRRYKYRLMSCQCQMLIVRS